ncbi:cytochrome C oxidase subunit II [Virgibacillus pantothenticus]|uniref:cytochrome C oxidase subunit II n=2 Tax=Bacillaceae TaxID=186817 RepID=UPI000FFF4BAC|nr:cytochrome C oxidase subunit II [Virgibacillus pantothenticus]MBU8566639.1 cytochrome C oxidase subunit II [Virgibacillus pantothenticus]MBU8645199.1 cytochrome C oxidase subunit II [Virgibacillus pantothenticus]MBU8661816.1 cytochrome C oxidase subunit II [Virgibacillus pantothenticus]MBU8667153.1 cytochrome C oxidase subunit II [Virgibacillus pantothenticus]MBU8703018.1 cytochrome C oxidase subunit II [Virgibacillus pantothenticus]
MWKRWSRRSKGKWSNSVPSNATQLDISATKFEQEEYNVTAGEKVTMKLSKEEGQHGIRIDELDVSIQGDGEVTFTPSEPGEYTIYCNIPCGEGHASMKSTLIVQ